MRELGVGGQVQKFDRPAAAATAAASRTATLLASEMTAQIAQASAGVVGIVSRTAAASVRLRLPHPCARLSGVDRDRPASGRSRSRARLAATAWKCPNDSANWIASANSASREPCLRCFRNHFTTTYAFPGGRYLGRPMLYYNIGRPWRCQPCAGECAKPIGGCVIEQRRHAVSRMELQRIRAPLHRGASIGALCSIRQSDRRLSAPRAPRSRRTRRAAAAGRSGRRTSAARRRP